MGGSQSRRDESFKPSQWEQVHDGEVANEGDGQYSVVRNRVTGQLLDRYLLQFPNEQEYNKYMESVGYRRSQPNIVRIIHYEPKIVKQFCGSAYMLNVYIEHCRSRLSEYEDIPFPDYLYCAMAMLDGYKKLYNKIGRFYVSEHQVMIDDEGEVRVWLNSDFSENQAQDLRTIPNNFNGSNDQQYEMVDDIMKMIFENSDEAEGPRLKLVDYYERQKNNYNNRVGFEEAKNIILDYSKMNNIQIPQLFKSVYEIYQSEEGRIPDTMAFKNQLLDNQINSDHDHLHKVGAPVRSAYDPVQSVIKPNQNQSQISANYSSGTGAFLRQGSHTVMPNLVSTMPAPGSIVHTGRLPAASQHSFAPTFNSSYQPRSMINPGPPFVPQTAPVSSFKGPSMIRQAPFIPPQSHGFPITIRPANTSSNLSVGRASGPPFNFPQQQIMNPPHFIQGPQQGAPSISRAPINIPPPPQNLAMPLPPQVQNQTGVAYNSNSQEYSKKQFVKKADSLPQDLTHQVIGGLYIAKDKDKIKKNKAQLGEQELEIEKNIILKGGNQSSSGDHQYINEANIIRDLSELHKIQQEQKSKRSAIQEQSSRNNSPGKNQDDEDDDKGYGYDEQSAHRDTSRQILGNASANNAKTIVKNNDYYEYDDGENLFRQESQQFDAAHKIEAPYENPTSQNTGYRSQPVYGQQVSFNNNQASPRFVQQSPSLPQQGQGQYFSGFNPHTNQGQRPQAPPMLNHFNSMQFSQTTGIGQNQTNYQNASNTNSIANNQTSFGSENVNKAGGSYKRQFYYTLSNEVELDPEIAADMALYVKS